MQKQQKASDHDRMALEPQKRITERQPANYSDKVMEEAASPSNMRRMAEADACGIIHGCCGDTMEIYLRLDAGTIQDATFMTDGHESAVASASMLTRWVKGMSLAKAGQIRAEDLLTALNGLPLAKTHCATLAVNTLGQAIANIRAEKA